MIKVGEYNTLSILRFTDNGVYLDDEAEGILLPRRYVHAEARVGEELVVFIYHDSESRIIATTDKPKGIVGDIVKLKAITVTEQGAFLDWGLTKDIFVPKSKQQAGMREGAEYLVKIYLDEQTNRVAATEKIEPFLSNDELTVKEMDEVSMIVYRRTDIGYVVIINNIHTGVLHFNEIYRNIGVGDKMKGFIKTIRPENKIDVVAGKAGYARVEGETEKIMRLLQENDGYLPYYDKSAPEDIYDFFGMSKKAFKMATGNLYKLKKIAFAKAGIQLLEN